MLTELETEGVKGGACTFGFFWNFTITTWPKCVLLAGTRNVSLVKTSGAVLTTKNKPTYCTSSAAQKSLLGNRKAELS